MMGHGGGGGGGEGDAERMLAQAEKLLLSGDLNGSKTYAIRACEADHSLVDPAELILAVADTLIAGESRIGGITSDLPDWYAVLRLVRLTQNPELVETQYSRLAVLLNPNRNRFPYAEQAYRLISKAWYVLSDPSRKALYDRELHLSQFGQLSQLGFQLFNQTPPSQSPQHQSQSPQHQQHQHQNQTASFQNQQLPFQLHQPHFAQPVQTQSQSQSQQQQQRSQFDQQQLLQEQQQASWRQQFGQEHSSGSSSDWKRPVEEERLINLNNATERVQPSRRFAEPDRPSSRDRTPSTDLTWPSKSIPTSEPWQSSQPARQFQSSSRSTEAAQLSLLPSVSQPTRSIQSHAVSKPQPVSKPHQPFPLSQPPQTSKHFPMSQSSQKSQPLPVSQPSSNSKPFLVSHSSQKSKPLPVSQLSSNSMPFPVSQPPSTSDPFPVFQVTHHSKAFPVSHSSSSSNQFPISQPTPISKPNSVSQPSYNAKPFPISQQPPASMPFPVSQPPPTSKPLPVSQPPTTSKPLPAFQPPPAFQSTHPSQPPAASQLPPVFNSTQSFQQPPVSTTPSPVPAASTVPSPNPPTPVSQPTRVSNQAPPAEQTPKSEAARSDSEPEIPSFWTTCPYCFVLYEYPDIYEESVLQCQTKSCRRAYQAVKVPSPPPVTDEDSYYCCWGFYPIGFSEVAKAPVSGSQTFPFSGSQTRVPFSGSQTRVPFSGLQTKVPVYDLPKSTPKKLSPKVYYYDDEEEDDDDSYIDSDPSEDDDDDDDDDDWQMSGTKRKKNVKQSKAKAPAKSKLRKVIEVD